MSTRFSMAITVMLLHVLQPAGGEKINQPAADS